MKQRDETHMKRKKAVGVRLRLPSLLAAPALAGFLRSAGLVTSTVLSTTCASEEKERAGYG